MFHVDTDTDTGTEVTLDQMNHGPYVLTIAGVGFSCSTVLYAPDLVKLRKWLDVALPKPRPKPSGLVRANRRKPS